MGQVNLDGYVTVAERIQRFYEAHPKGEIATTDVRIVETNGKSFVMVSACATTDELPPRDGHATAWEPIPGRTSFTQNSEVMNAETSAWGRAIAALGFEVKDGVASREEMAAASAPTRRSGNVKPAHVDPLFKQIKAAKDANLITSEQVKLQLLACGIEDPKGTKGDLGRLSTGQAKSLEDWLTGLVKAA